MTELIKNSFRYFRQLVLRLKVIQTTSFVVNTSSVLIIAPHPDDETFGSAGLIAKKVKANVHVSVAFLTYGENSLKSTPDIEVSSNRKKTAETVCRNLGVQDIQYCGFSDGNIPRRDTDEYDKGVKTLEQLVKQVNPQEVFCTHDKEGWSDHTAAAELTYDALKHLNSTITLYYYWVWVWFSIPFKKINSLNFSDTYFLKISDVIEQKNLAISSYLKSTNAQGEAYCGRLPKMFLKAFEWPYEVYEKVQYK
jgi:LmbE family N-acetylglucosaminyl deacetylase